MLHPLISIGVGAVIAILFGGIFGKIVYGIIPGVLVAIGVMVWLSRRVMLDLQRRMNRVQELLTPRTMRPGSKPPFDEAVSVLEGGMKWVRWQPLVEGQLAGHIGSIYYLDKRFKEATPWLEKSTPRNWVAMAMLGANLYRRKRDDEMKATFEKAVKHSAKESLAWNMYAWCLWKRDDLDGAIAVLNRARETVKNDERTDRNLEALQNRRGMKMGGWEMMWYQFHLETPPQAMMPQARFSRRHTR